MKINRLASFACFFALILVGALLISCGTKEKGVERTQIAPVGIPKTNEGIVTFVSGDVTITSGNNTKPAESGDKIAKNASVKTGPDSTCEITLGDTAVVSVEENTVCSINSLVLDKKSSVGIEVALGSVLSKVKKLTEKESFNVRTDSAVCGVRGTEFLVTKGSSGDTLIAVTNGKVVVLPPAVTTESFKDIDTAQYPKIAAVMDRLETLVPNVTENHELVVKRDSFTVVQAAYTILSKVMEKAEQKEIVTQAELTELDKATDKVAKTSAASPISQTDISEANKQKLLATAKFSTFTKTDLGMEEKSEAGTKNENIDLAKINIKADPQNAEITVNGESRGRGSVSLLAAFGKELSILVRLDGYTDKAFRISPKEKADSEYKIVLEKKQTENNTTVETIKSDKDDKAVTAEKENTDKDKEKEGATAKITQPERPVVKAVFQITYAPIVGNMSLSNGTIIISDKYGIVTESDSSGKRVWSVSTDNSSNENSFPVVTGNRAYFSGAQELVIIDTASGQISARKKLDSSSSHIFGRRIVPFGTAGLFPKDGGIEVFDLANGNTIREINIPRKSSMTPTVYNGSILTVDQEGYVLFINGSTGAVETELKTGATQPVGLDLTVANNKAFTAGRNGNVICVDLAAKKLAWEKSLAAERRVSVSSDIEAGDMGIYLFGSGTLYALAQSSGERLFAPITSVTCPPLYVHGNIIYGTADKNLNVADAKTGRVIKSVLLNSKITSRPAIDASGTIYAGADSGAVFLIDSQAMK